MLLAKERIEMALPLLGSWRALRRHASLIFWLALGLDVILAAIGYGLLWRYERQGVLLATVLTLPFQLLYFIDLLISPRQIAWLAWCVANAIVLTIVMSAALISALPSASVDFLNAEALWSCVTSGAVLGCLAGGLRSAWIGSKLGMVCPGFMLLGIVISFLFPAVS